MLTCYNIYMAPKNLWYPSISWNKYVVQVNIPLSWQSQYPCWDALRGPDAPRLKSLLHKHASLRSFSALQITCKIKSKTLQFVVLSFNVARIKMTLLYSFAGTRGQSLSKWNACVTHDVQLYICKGPVIW